MNRLISLDLEHFQKHRTFSHRFSDGLTVCFGPNWAGKSTLQRAILYALFGTSAVPVKAANLVTQGERTMEVRLGFSIEGVTYLVSRGTRGAVLRREGEPVASGHTAVTDSIEALIGTAKDFLHFQTVRQGDAASLLTLGSAKLGEHLDRATGVVVVDRVLERVREAQRPLEGSEAALAQARTAQAEAAAQHAQVQQELARKQARIGAAADDLARLKSDLGTRQQALATQREQAAQRLRLEAQLEALGPETVADPEACAALSRQIAELQEATQVLWRREALEEGLAQAKEILSRPRPAVSREDFERSQEQVAQADRHSRQCREALEQIKSGVCQACHRPFEARDPEEFRQAVETAEAQSKEAAQQALEARIRHDQVHCDYRAGEGYQSWEDYHRTASAELASLPQVEAIPQDAIEALRQQEWVLQQAIKAAPRRAGLKAQLAGLGEQVDVSGEEAAVQALNEEIRAKETALAIDRNELTLLSNQEQALTRRLSDLEAAVEDFARQAQRSWHLGKLAKYLRTNRDRFSQDAWGQVLGIATDFVREATGGDVTALLREGDEFFYEEGGERRPIELASGLQAAILGVAVKLALAAAVGSRFEVMLFDEVSAGAQDENSLRLTECLSRVAGQVFLISHREMDASVAADVLSL